MVKWSWLHKIICRHTWIIIAPSFGAYGFAGVYCRKCSKMIGRYVLNGKIDES